MLETITIRTSNELQFVDITREVEKVVEGAGIKDGIATIFTRHTTTAIIINENESHLLRDFKTMLDTLVPKGRGYGHDTIDSNAHAHMRSVLLGASETIPVHEGRLQLGTWQCIFLVELDGPRNRNVIVQVIG